MTTINATEFAERLAEFAREAMDGADAEVLRFHTNVRAELRGPDGELKDVRDMHNVICQPGKNVLLASASPKTASQWSYVCVGTGTNAAASTDTALQTELTRVAGTVSTPSAGTLQIVGTFGAGVATGAITESALDSGASASGAILAHQVFAAVNKGASDTLTVTWTLT